MNDDFFALVDTDALKALSGQPSASGAAMLLVDTHGLIRAQTAAAGELLELENGDLLASALSDEAVALVEDCASGGGANSMTEHLDVGDCRLTVVPHPDGALVALEPQPLRLPRGLSYVCGDTLNASIARLYDLAAKASDPALAAALSREMFRLQRMAFHVTELLDPPVFGTINAHDCELSRLCSDVADQILRRLPEDRRDCIMTSVPMRCSSYVDAVRLRAALYNLLLNAVAVSSDPGRLHAHLRNASGLRGRDARICGHDGLRQRPRSVSRALPQRGQRMVHLHVRARAHAPDGERHAARSGSGLRAAGRAGARGHAHLRAASRRRHRNASGHPALRAPYQARAGPLDPFGFRPSHVGRGRRAQHFIINMTQKRRNASC